MLVYMRSSPAASIEPSAEYACHRASHSGSGGGKSSMPSAIFPNLAKQRSTGLAGSSSSLRIWKHLWMLIWNSSWDTVPLPDWSITLKRLAAMAPALLLLLRQWARASSGTQSISMADSIMSEYSLWSPLASMLPPFEYVVHRAWVSAGVGLSPEPRRASLPSFSKARATSLLGANFLATSDSMTRSSSKEARGMTAGPADADADADAAA